MYSVQFTHAGKKETTTTDAKTEREAKRIFERSLSAATVDWSTFTNIDAKPLIVTKKESKPEKPADVHL